MARSQQARRSSSRLPLVPLLGAVAALAVAVGVGAVLWDGTGEETERAFTGVPVVDPGPVHVHGLGINPADGALFIATHTGLFRVASDARSATRIADRYQDTMGFSVVGPDRFIGSGHPDARERGKPPLLGLIESRDAGETWTPVSLSGQADFHVLRTVGASVYGYDASGRRLLVSADRGRTWAELPQPGPLLDLVPHPRAPQRLVATVAEGSGAGTYASRDGGRSWRRLGANVGLLAWPVPGRLYLVDAGGWVRRSPNGGATLEQRGRVGGEPAALLASGPDELLVALHDGTIKRSTDGGVLWSVRSAP
jgi:hypothetical protein